MKLIENAHYLIDARHLFAQNNRGVLNQIFGFVPVNAVPDDYIEVVATKEKRRGGGKRKWRLDPVEKYVADQLWFEFYPEIVSRSNGSVFPARIHVLWYWDKERRLESSSFIGGLDILHEYRDSDIADMLDFLVLA